MKRWEDAFDDSDGTDRVDRELRAGKPRRAGEQAQPALGAFARSGAVISTLLIGTAVMLLAALLHRMRGVRLLRGFVGANRHHRRGDRGQRQPEGKEDSQQFAQHLIHRFMLAHSAADICVGSVAVAEVLRLAPPRGIPRSMMNFATHLCALANRRRYAFAVSFYWPKPSNENPFHRHP